MLVTGKRMIPPVRKSIASREIFQNNRFIKMSLAELDTS